MPRVAHDLFVRDTIFAASGRDEPGAQAMWAERCRPPPKRPPRVWPHGDEAVHVTPGLVVHEVDYIGPERRRGIRGVLVDLRLGERHGRARVRWFGAVQRGQLTPARLGE
jgi:hypothetical protein